MKFYRKDLYAVRLYKCYIVDVVELRTWDVGWDVRSIGLQNSSFSKIQPKGSYLLSITTLLSCLLVKHEETATPTNKEGIIERHAWFTEADRCTCFGLTAPKESVARSVIYLGKIIPDRASRRLLLRLRHGGRRTGLGGRLQFSVAITFLMTRGSVLRIRASNANFHTLQKELCRMVRVCFDCRELRDTRHVRIRITIGRYFFPLRFREWRSFYCILILCSRCS